MFENTKKEPVDTVDQNAREFAKNFPAVCAVRTFTIDTKTEECVGKILATNGVLIHVDQKENAGYVLTNGRQFKQNKTRDRDVALENDLMVIELSFLDCTSTLNLSTKDSRIFTGAIYSIEDFTQDDEICLSIVKFDLPENFSIEPMKIYDGEGYKKGNLMGAFVVSYGVFKTPDSRPVKDFIRRGGQLKVRHTSQSKGPLSSQYLVSSGSLGSAENIFALKPGPDCPLTDHQVWPYQADEGAPAILKTSRGYQLAGIYFGLVPNLQKGTGAHTWHFVPQYKQWIQDVLDQKFNPSNAFAHKGPMPKGFELTRVLKEFAAKNGGTTHSNK